uniref:Uncharacterized protein n=1 Tax=Timema poppense TaxID=170557 RepID=A0A7R9D6K0_TIMPO|nr:unnamed protein product [Timema poppensis]
MEQCSGMFRECSGAPADYRLHRLQLLLSQPTKLAKRCFNIVGFDPDPSSVFRLHLTWLQLRINSISIWLFKRRAHHNVMKSRSRRRDRVGPTW